MSKPVKNYTKTEEKKKQEVTTLRGVKRMARNGVSNWTGPKVRTRSGYAVTARIINGRVETRTPSGWEEYPEVGKNLDPTWSPTTPKGTTAEM